MIELDQRRRITTQGLAIAMTRKRALKRLQGLAPQVEAHLEKIRQNPTSREAPHWRKEADVWIQQMENMLPYVGRNTREEWEQRIENWRHETGS